MKPIRNPVCSGKEPKPLLLDHPDFSCQYLKIHCDFKGDKYTFAEDFESIIKIYGPPDFS
jgi:hypothetical protein